MCNQEIVVQCMNYSLGREGECLQKEVSKREYVFVRVREYAYTQHLVEVIKCSQSHCVHHHIFVKLSQFENALCLFE